MRERCPVCGIRLARGEEGYQVGAYMFNMIAAELIFAAIFLVILVYTWPDPPWTPLLYGGIVLMIVLPALFYPFSKTLFLAFDLVFRPPTADGLSSDGISPWLDLRKNGGAVRVLLREPSGTG